MKDAFFEHAVVLLWHHDEDGAVGVVINKALDHQLPDVLAATDGLDLTPYAGQSVGWGGPVESGSGTVIARGGVTDDEGWPLADDLAVTRSQEALNRLIGEQRPLLLCLGYAGWGPGQLDREIADGSWLWADASADLVFQVPVDQRYATALSTLGLTPQVLWQKPIEE